MNEEKIKKVFSDEEFVKSLMNLETPEAVQKALEEKDIDLSVEDIKKIAELVQKKDNGELSEDELEEVAGGTDVGAIAAVVGAVVGSPVAIVGGVVASIKRRRW